jgi:5,10-methylene-tetrahydrofolate dehydrogenase/methenyl tetrahydrofolate cyclohydrolase
MGYNTHDAVDGVMVILPMAKHGNTLTVCILTDAISRS